MTHSYNKACQGTNLYLVGLMGTGKSAIGKKLAKEKNKEFIDSDQEIEKSSGMSISQIFTKYGESHFRKLERKFIIDVQSARNCVIACGGGLCIPEGMMDLLKKTGKVVCLWASPETLVDRTKVDDSRPLLNVANPLLVLRNLLSEREMKYREADIIIETDHLSQDEVVREIVKHFPED